MRCVTLAQAGPILGDLCETAVCDREEILLTGESGNVILIAQDDWEMTQETVRLLRDKDALRSLLEGHQTRDEGRVPAGKSPEEVFHDLVDQHSSSS